MENMAVSAAYLAFMAAITVHTFVRARRPGAVAGTASVFRFNLLLTVALGLFSVPVFVSCSATATWLIHGLSFLVAAAALGYLWGTRARWRPGR